MTCIFRVQLHVIQLSATACPQTRVQLHVYRIGCNCMSTEPTATTCPQTRIQLHVHITDRNCMFIDPGATACPQTRMQLHIHRLGYNCTSIEPAATACPQNRPQLHVHRPGCNCMSIEPTPSQLFIFCNTKISFIFSHQLCNRQLIKEFIALFLLLYFHFLLNQHFTFFTKATFYIFSVQWKKEEEEKRLGQ